ncbi:MAG: hypothetical protein ASARMPRED_005007 [Alectoria sarmentosa]|nr:MAG: hypothetical protein ASARMPRED_005007 [Alectoria sarmentosa]
MLVISVLAYALLALPSAQASCGPISDVTLTFYGWPDNSPPGSDNAFDCGRGTNADGNPIAGGSGTYDDPISFATATDNKNLPRCAIVYVPLLRKYFRNEDDCAQCLTDWDSKGEYHIDLWTGSNTAGGGQDQINCEDSLPGGSQTTILDPPNSLPVDNLRDVEAVDVLNYVSEGKKRAYNDYPTVVPSSTADKHEEALEEARV